MIFVRGRSFARVRLMMRRMMLKLKTVANLPVIVLKVLELLWENLDCLRERMLPSQSFCHPVNRMHCFISPQGSLLANFDTEFSDIQ